MANFKMGTGYTNFSFLPIYNGIVGIVVGRNYRYINCYCSLLKIVPDIVSFAQCSKKVSVL